MSQVELLFLGTGTSAGIPMIGCDCPTCTSDDPRDRRTRPSALVSCDGVSVLVDTSPELRVQCLANNVKSIDAVAFTHAHADHIMGLDDVRRFNTIRGSSLDVWADRATSESLQRAFGYAFRSPDPAEKVYRPYLVHRPIVGPFDIGPMLWIPIPLMHGTMPVLGFRVGSLAYCTDVSHVPQQSYGMLMGLDVLVIDGLQRTPHPTHFSIDQAIEVAMRVGAQRTYLTHIAHQVRHAEVEPTLPDGVRLGYDGLRVTTEG